MRDKLFGIRLFQKLFFQKSWKTKRLRALRYPICTAPVDSTRAFSQSQATRRPSLADSKTGDIIHFDAELNT
jgi:hypothetical protein